MSNTAVIPHQNIAQLPAVMVLLFRLRHVRVDPIK
jgi:hypothetical protein